MKANEAVSGKIGWLLKSLLAAYALTGILLLGLAMILYKLNVEENVVSAGIIGIYVTSTFFGGLIIGKMAKVRRFFWGLTPGSQLFPVTFNHYTGCVSDARWSGGRLYQYIVPVCRRRNVWRYDILRKRLRNSCQNGIMT